MSPEEIRLLWGRVLAGEELLLDDQRRLVEALEADPALRADLLDDVELDGMLRSLGAVRRGGEGFVQTLAGSVDRERDATRFVEKVELRLADGPPEPPSKRETPRPFALRTISRRFTQPGRSSGAGWKAALAASVVFGIILLFAAASSRPSSNTPPSGPRPDISHRSPGSAPVAPLAPLDQGVAEEVRIRSRIREIEEKRQRLQQAPVAPEESTEDRRRSLDELERRRRIEEDFLRELEEKRRPAPTPPSPEAPKAPPQKTESSPLRHIADAPILQRTDGRVYEVGSLRSLKAGESLAPGQTIFTVEASRTALLRYADGTSVELLPETRVRSVADDKARRLFVERGVIAADIRKQPAGRPMIFETPSAEARILGTSIRLAVAPGKDKAGESTLEVIRGKVELKRLSDGATAEVSAGQFAIAAATVKLQANKTFPSVVKINFGPANTVVTGGWLNDSGEVYDAARGYGWDGSQDGRFIDFWKNPNGTTEERRHGRFTALRSAGLKPDEWQKATSVVAGWGEASETWRMAVPNGRYRVTVCVGDQTFEQGPHVVAMNGRPVWEPPPLTRPNRNGGFLEGSVALDVKEGELKMTVGGLPVKPSVDGSVDTILSYIIIERLK